MIFGSFVRFSIFKDLSGDPQADLYARVRSELDVSTLRDSLNKVRRIGGAWDVVL